jgi:hypothetical protein
VYNILHRRVTISRNFVDMENWKTHLKRHVFRYQISENTFLETRFCTGSGRRTPDLKFIKMSYGLVLPPVDRFSYILYPRFSPFFTLLKINTHLRDTKLPQSYTTLSIHKQKSCHLIPRSPPKTFVKKCCTRSIFKVVISFHGPLLKQNFVFFLPRRSA